MASPYPILDGIISPADLRLLDAEQLPEVADEMRRFLIDTTSRTGGHLAPGLGMVELTLALHYVFDTPDDRIVWDIGHQAYPHKILTGRRKQFESLRQKDGLSGFLKRSESPYDTFGAGHSSTSISAALGMAVAAQLRDEDKQVIAVIGDGALTGGMAFEALNNAGAMDANLLVILNDNEMSISPNVGAISNYLARILTGRAYTSVREGSKTVLSTLNPEIKNLARRWEEHLKGMVMPGTLFEELGFNYIGPVDGHNTDVLMRTLSNLKGMTGPRFLHVVTQKGKGYEPAEGNPCIYHGVTPFNPDTGKLEKKKATRNYTHVFSDWLCDMAAQDDRLIGITPAMREGSGLVAFAEQFPERYHDVGIAEQHAMTFAGGLAAEGLKPVLAIYSTFLQRAYDQLIHDVSIQDLDVTLAIDRAGLVGADGATHAGVYDYSFLRCIPNIVIMAPADESECRNMLYTAYQHPGMAAVRYPRGNGRGIKEQQQMTAIPIGKAEQIRQGQRVAILSFGSMLDTALMVAEDIDATVINMRFVKPLDEQCLLDLCLNHDMLVTLEENVLMGGAGSAVNEFIAAQGLTVRMLNFAIPDRHLDHGSQQQQLDDAGLDPAAIKAGIFNALPAQPKVAVANTLD